MAKLKNLETPMGQENQEPDVSLDEILNNTQEDIEGKPKIEETEAEIIGVDIRYYDTKVSPKGVHYKPTSIVIKTEYDLEGEKVVSEDAYGGLNAFLNESGQPRSLGNIQEDSESYFANLARMVLGMSQGALTQGQVIKVINTLKEYAQNRQKVLIETEVVQFGIKGDKKNKQVIQKFL